MLKRSLLVLKALLVFALCKAQEIDFEKRFHFNKDSISLKSNVVFNKEGLLTTLKITNIGNKPIPNFIHRRRGAYVRTDSIFDALALYVNRQPNQAGFTSHIYYNNEVLLKGQTTEKEEWVNLSMIGLYIDGSNGTLKKQEPDRVSLQWSYLGKLSDEIIVDLKNKRIVKE